MHELKHVGTANLVNAVALGVVETHLPKLLLVVVVVVLVLELWWRGVSGEEEEGRDKAEANMVAAAGTGLLEMTGSCG